MESRSPVSWFFRKTTVFNNALLFIICGGVWLVFVYRLLLARLQQETLVADPNVGTVRKKIATKQVSPNRLPKIDLLSLITVI